MQTDNCSNQYLYSFKSELQPLIDKISLLLIKAGEVTSADFLLLEKLASIHDLTPSALSELIKQVTLKEVSHSPKLNRFIQWVELINKSIKSKDRELTFFELKHLYDLAPKDGFKTRYQLISLLLKKQRTNNQLFQNIPRLSIKTTLVMLLAIFIVWFLFFTKNQDNQPDNLIQEADTFAWQQAKQKNTLIAYQAYLTTQIDGQYRTNAERALTYLYNQQQFRVKQQAQLAKENLERVKDILQHLGYQIPQTSSLDDNTLDAINDVLQASSFNDVAIKKVSVNKDINENLLKILEQALVEKDNLAWQLAKSGNTLTAFQQYIKKFPEGEHIREAKFNLDNLHASRTRQENNAKKALQNQQNQIAQQAIDNLLSSFVIIPAGSIIMGCTKEPCKEKEKPAHQVNLSSFNMMATEVTFAMWQACLIKKGCQHKPDNNMWEGDTRPVIMVSYQDVVEQFIPWFNQLTGKTYSLPSEAQWEYVRRADDKTINCTMANYAQFHGECGNERKTLPVMSYPKNAYGVYDLQGNVWEWTQDCWNDNYNGATNNGQAWLSGQCEARVLRGGSWLNNVEVLRASARKGKIKSNRSNDTGFRLVLNK